LRGALLMGAVSEGALAERLRSVQNGAEVGRAPEPTPPAEADLRAPERLAIDYATASDLAGKSAKALKALAAGNAAIWKVLRAQGIFRGHGPAPKIAFLYSGSGSQYVNMLQALRAAEPIVAETFVEADRVMMPLLGKPLSEFIFVDGEDADAFTKAEEDLSQITVTQSAVLAADMALTRLLAAYGIEPDMTMGHSLGEFGALVASGALSFDEALEIVSVRSFEAMNLTMALRGAKTAAMRPFSC
jgi:acyl transferase domain-containing protein